MTTTKAWFVATAFLGALSGAAQAGGPTAVDAEATPAVGAVDPIWQGLHFGLSQAEPTGEAFFWMADVGAYQIYSDPGSFDGKLTTVSFGHDWQRGNLVFGAELNLSSGSLIAHPQPRVDPNYIFICNGCEVSVDNLKSLTGRVGYAFGRTLVYGTAGMASADIATLDNGFSDGAGSLTGWTVGLGVERFVSDRVTVSVEYLQTDLGRLPLPALGPDGYTDIAFDQVRVGINLRW